MRYIVNIQEELLVIICYFTKIPLFNIEGLYKPRDSDRCSSVNIKSVGKLIKMKKNKNNL